MWRASPITTVSVTLTSGWSDVPDFSAYLRAYAHILSMLPCAGCFMSSPCQIERAGRVALRERRQRRLDGVGVEARELLVADEEHGKREQPERDQLLSGL